MYSPGWTTLWLSSSIFKCSLRYDYQLHFTNEENRTSAGPQLWSSWAFTSLSTAGGFKSAFLTTLEDLGPAGASSKKAQCLELIAEMKMPQNRGPTLLEGSVERIAPDGSVSSHWPLWSDKQTATLSTRWVSAATIIETRLAEWKAHCIRKQRRKNRDATCDTLTSTLGTLVTY